MCVFSDSTRGGTYEMSVQTDEFYEFICIRYDKRQVCTRSPYAYTTHSRTHRSPLCTSSSSRERDTAAAAAANSDEDDDKTYIYTLQIKCAHKSSCMSRVRVVGVLVSCIISVSFLSRR